jgi:hypothetical protein
VSIKELWDKLPKWIRWSINRIDDPFDTIMERLHCGEIFNTGYQFNLAFLMKNRGRPYWPIIRKHRIYPNCDPGDLK